MPFVTLYTAIDHDSNEIISINGSKKDSEEAIVNYLIKEVEVPKEYNEEDWIGGLPEYYKYNWDCHEIYMDILEYEVSWNQLLAEVRSELDV